MITSRQVKNVGMERNREVEYKRKKANAIGVEIIHIAN